MRNSSKIKKSSFIEGTIIATISIIVSKVMGMFYVIPFYAMIGIQGSALYAYAYNIYVIFLDISSAGLPIAMSKVINEYNTLGLMEEKQLAYCLGKKIMVFIAIVIFIVLFLFAPFIGEILLGDLSGGNTINEVTLAIRCVSLAILIVPFLSITKGYLQGHNVIGLSSFSQVIEQIVRISVILGGSYIVLKVFGGSETLAVCVSLLGAFIGGVVAYIFLKVKLKNDSDFNICNNIRKGRTMNKVIIKKILTYAVPFIIINIIGSCYNFVDMTLLLKTMNYLGLDVNDIEFVTSAVTTWAPKINMIVTSIAMGMSTSFIPVMVTNYTLNNWDEVNKKFNQAMQILIFVSLPMVVGISLLSKEIWTIFYGYNIVGSYILMLNVFTGLLINIYMITSSALQGLNKFKIVYKVTLSGFLINALLDVPLMIFYNKIGIPPYLGAITASIIGYGVSIIIGFKGLKKECKLNYGDTISIIKKMIIPMFLMIFVVLLINFFIPINYGSRLFCVIFVIIEAICGSIVYFVVSYKMGILNKIIGDVILNKIIKKLTFGKLSN